MSMILKISIKSNNDFEGCEPDPCCIFSQKMLIVDNLIIPVRDDTPIGLFKHGKVSNFIQFKALEYPCWCGCDNNNWVDLQIEHKEYFDDHKEVNEEVEPECFFVDVESDSENDESIQFGDEKQQYAIENFPRKNIVEHYSSYEYDLSM